MSTGRDPIFEQLDALIAEGPQDAKDVEARERRADREYLLKLIREAGVSIDIEAVYARLQRDWTLHDAIHKPVVSNGKKDTKKGKKK